MINGWLLIVGNNDRLLVIGDRSFCKMLVVGGRLLLIVDVFVCLFVMSVVCWSVNLMFMLLCWSVGMYVFVCIVGLLNCRFVGVSVHPFAGLLVCHFVDLLMPRLLFSK